MMRIIVTILLSLYSILSVGQEPKVLKKKENTRNGKANYFVLKSDPTIYHGKYYIVAWTGNEKLVDGNYVLGKKQGLWTERYYGAGNKRGIRSLGNYQDDLRTGIWTYFAISGDTSQVYDYSTNTLLFSNECNNTNCPPLYKGGKDILVTDLSQQISMYPVQLKALGFHSFEINSNVKIKIDTLGKVTDISFSKEIGYGYEEKIMNWLKLESNEWIPAKLNGRLVESHIELPIRQKFQF